MSAIRSIIEMMERATGDDWPTKKTVHGRLPVRRAPIGAVASRIERCVRDVIRAASFNKGAPRHDGY